MGEPLELKVKNYPHLQLRRYGVVLAGPHGRQNKPFIPPSAAFIGRVLAETPATLERMARDWLANGDEEHEGYEPKIDLSRKFLVWVNEGSYRQRRRQLKELTPDDLVHNIKQRLQRKYGSQNLWDVGGREAFDLREGEGGHIGNIVLSGKVKSKGHGGSAGTPKYYDLTIAGALQGSRIPFGKVMDGCNDFSFTFAKQGYVGLELIDTHAAALLYFAEHNPSELRNAKAVRSSRGEDLHFWQPFHADQAQRTKYVTRHMRAGVEDLSGLTFEVLLDVLFNNRPLAEIDKDLVDIPVLYDPQLVAYLERGDAAFEAVVREYAYEVGKPIHGATRAQFNQMRDVLGRRGFAMAGYILENRGTDEELVTLEFRKATPRGWESVRWVADGGPSAYVKRVSNPLRRPDLFAESHAKVQSPFAELYHPKHKRDDRTRAATFYEARLPLEVPIPDQLRDDYRAMIEAEFVGPRGVQGLNGLEQQVQFRNRMVVRENLPAVPLDANQMRNLYKLTRG